MSEPTRAAEPEVEATTAPPGGGYAGSTGAAEDAPEGAFLRPSELPGYQLLEEIGRGGMGVVYRARDTAMNREVAVKILQDRFAPDSGTAARFVEEAQITGQLQHPGIPAVYHVGALPDRRPFLAMKLIRGDTLDARLKANAPLDPLAVFEAISQAVGYAHAHGVIHRDLKPANVMVGAFGEVQVMDWGLAKVLAAGRSPDRLAADPGATAAATEIRTRRDSDGSFTQVGSVLGTPAFMPPEQAGGELDKIDTRSDVFGLGAMLCVLLTGQPPFEGKDAESVRLNAVRGRTEAAFARLDASGADPDVVALCKRCLAFEPADRPATANDVAASVAALRRAADDRAKQAERDKLAAEVQAAEQRKRRRTVLVAGGILVAVLTVGVIGTAWGLVEARRQERAARAERDEKERARQAEADQRQRAEAGNRRALKAADLMAGQIGTSLLPIAGTRSNTVVAALDNARTIYDELVADPDAPPEAVAGKAKLLTDFADLYRVTRRTGKSKAAAVEAIALYDRLLTTTQDPETRKRYQLDRARARKFLANTLNDQRYGAEAIAEFRRSIAEYEAAGGAEIPVVAAGHFAASHTLLANVLRQQGDFEGARVAYDAGLALRRTAAARQPADRSLQGQLAISLERLGELIAETGDRAEGARLLREARKIDEAILAADPLPSRSANTLVRVLATLAGITPDTAEAKECVATAQAVMQKYPNQDTDNTSVLRQQLRAEFQKSEVTPTDAKDLDAQRKALNAQLDLLTKLRQIEADIVRDDPDNFDSLSVVANFDGRLAEVHLKLAAGDDPDGRRAKARDLIAASVAAYRKILERDSDDRDANIGLIYALSLLPKAETNPAAAFAHKFEFNRTKLEYYLRLVARHPRTPTWQIELERAFLSVAYNPINHLSSWPEASKDARVAGPLVALARVLAVRPPGTSDDTWAKATTARRRIAEFLADVDATGHLPADARALRSQFPEVAARPAAKVEQPAKVHPFDPAGTWRAVAPPGGRFRVWLPGELVRSEQSIPSGEYTLAMTAYSLGEPGVGVVTTDYPPPMFEKMRTNLAGVFDGAVSGTIGTGKLLTREEIAFGPHKLPGREFTFHSADGKTRYRVRIVLLDNRMFMLLAFGSPDFVASPAVGRVFDTFEIVPPPVAPPPRPKPEK